jgi:hypothetical protein
MAPDGIRELFTGGGDWRRLPCAERPWPRGTSGEEVMLFAWALAAAAAAALVALEEGDDRRCLTR